MVCRSRMLTRTAPVAAGDVHLGYQASNGRLVGFDGSSVAVVVASCLALARTLLSSLARCPGRDWGRAAVTWGLAEDQRVSLAGTPDTKNNG